MTAQRDPGHPEQRLTVPAEWSAAEDPAAAVHTAVAFALADATSSADAAHRVSVAVATVMQWPLVEIWLADDGREVITCAARHAAAGRAFPVFDIHELRFGAGLPGRAARTGQPTWAADLTGVLGPAARRGLTSAVAVPMRAADGNVVGVLAVYRDHRGAPPEALLRLLRMIADRAGRHLQHRRGGEIAIASARSKDEFLAMAAHELREPLTQLTAAAAELEALPGTGSDQRRPSLEAVRRSADRIAVLIDDLLGLTGLQPRSPARGPRRRTPHRGSPAPQQPWRPTHRPTN
jgi:signal transduction histidine kinase